MVRNFNLTEEEAEAISAKNRAAKSRRSMSGKDGRKRKRGTKMQPGKVPVSMPSVPDLKCLKVERHIGMNYTERLFSQILDGMKRDGIVAEWRFENEIFDIGNGLTYRPDFPTLFADGSKTYYETKGEQIWEKNRIKFLIAAALFPEYTWVMIQRKSSGQWVELIRVRNGKRVQPQKDFCNEKRRGV